MDAAAAIPGGRTGAIMPVLMFTAISVSLMSTLGGPLIPTVAHAQHVSLDSAQWMLTVTLLTGAVAAAVMGRLGDGPHRKAVILGALATVAAGGVLGAVAPNFGVLIAGRALQGAGMGIMPLTIAAARDFLPPVKARSGIATLSVTTSVGAGLGYPITGFIARELNYRAAFWFAAFISACAIVLVGLVVPKGAHAPRRPLDVWGALLLCSGLAALLLAVSQGESWGWGSARVLGLFAAAVLLFTGWVVQGLRAAHPLVELRLLANRAVLSADVAAVLIGVGLYMTMSLINLYGQAPKSTGYGYGLSVVGAGLVLMPLSLGSLVSNRLVVLFSARFGTRLVLPFGATVVAGDMLWLATSRSSLWELVVSSVLLGVGVGTTFAAMPALIVRAVPPGETGSATSLNAVLRSVGGAVGSAVTGALLAAYTPVGGGAAEDKAYTVAFTVGAVVALCGGLAALVLPGRGGGDGSGAVPVEAPRGAPRSATV